jgi:catechol 2,3-dioxygenase-like lactoylglutathione lyase family enzyme
MIGYTMVGTNDLQRAKTFYGPLFDLMGLSLCFEDDQVASWGDRDDDTVPRFFACYPFDGGPANAGNGTMTTFRLGTASHVDGLYERAISGGGRDEGPPDFRPERYGDKFYVAYVRDPDGNKLAFACYDGKSNP